jgi:L-2,4-diaminobutyrate transaminase
MNGLRARLTQHPHVGEIRGKGFMCAVEFVKDRETKQAFAPEEQVGARVHEEAQKRGLFSRIRGDVFVLAPPFVTPDDLVDRIAEILADATEAVLGRP